MNGPHGHCDPRFTPIRDLLAHRLARGDELGASVCVIRNGRTVVDLWGGIADADSGRVWERDTVTNTYSVTKTMTALVALTLIDRRLLDPDAPVSSYWPEFAEAGKQDVLVRHVLGHTSGVSGWQQDVSLEDVYDTARSVALLAAQPPWWTPGERSGYHAMTYGHLVGELVRRVTGRSIGEFLAEELAGPLEADYWIGAPASIDERLATLVPPPSSGMDYSTLSPESIVVKTMLNPTFSPRVASSRPFVAAEIAGMNGQGNARSVARLQSLVSHGGTLDGRRYLADSTVERVLVPQSDGVDRVLGARVRFGLGYALAVPEALPEIPEGRVCFWVGLGGSFVVNDLDRRMTVAYTMNRMAPSVLGAENTRAYLRAVYSAVDG